MDAVATVGRIAVVAEDGEATLHTEREDGELLASDNNQVLTATVEEVEGTSTCNYETMRFLHLVSSSLLVRVDRRSSLANGVRPLANLLSECLKLSSVKYTRLDPLDVSHTCDLVERATDQFQTEESAFSMETKTLT